MRSPGALLLPLLLIGSTIGLSACAGEDDEDAIRDTIETSLTSTDPADCAGSDTTTAAFRRQYAFGSAELARQYEKLCRAETKRLAATAVEVSGVNVDGDRAQARFLAAGGQYVLREAAGRSPADLLRATAAAHGGPQQRAHALRDPATAPGFQHDRAGRTDGDGRQPR